VQKLEGAFHNRMAQLPPRPSERTIKETLKEFKSKDKKSVVVNMTAFLLDGLNDSEGKGRLLQPMLERRRPGSVGGVSRTPVAPATSMPNLLD